VDQLLDQARSETNPARLADLYKQAMTLIWRDAPWIFLHSESQTTGVRREVQDLVVHPTERILAHTAWLRR
jgi:ABC-type transport system substrate-binding protein